MEREHVGPSRETTEFPFEIVVFLFEVFGV